MKIRPWTAMFAIAATFSLLSAQEPEPAPAETPAPAAKPAAGAQRPGGAPSTDPQPYDKVITKEAKSKDGVFKVHQVKDRYYYEIPKGEFGKEFLWVSQIAKTTLGAGYGGQALGNRVVRWERNSNSNNKVNLRQVLYEVVADPNKPVAQAVRAANNDSILMSFPIAALGPEDSVVIEVTRLFTADLPEFSAKQRLRANTLDASRSYIERISPYPENIEAQVSHTYTRAPQTPGAPQAPVNPFLGTGMRPGSATVVLHHSMVKLPENPMMPRLRDDRVGYFSVSKIDYGIEDEHRAARRRYITRWRLEKKDPSAELSEPVKPIVYWIDSATPAKWVPYMIRGVEKWQKAFEAAGFKNAIIAKVAPTPEEDPDFHAEDARYSVIRWLPSTIENASGPHIHDPRTGEILDSDIQFYHNVQNLLRSWYFVQVAPLDPRAQKLPFPDDLMGELIEFVCAHEVGHTLGFPHNMKSSSMYPAEKVRDREWVKKMGHTPSIMDYSRFNYVAQPEDNIDVADLIPGIGPYDIWMTRWGYAPIPGAETPEEEKATLDAWAREQENTPWYRFSAARSGGSDPGELTEAVGDADAVYSTELGIKNLQRVAKLLMTATTQRPGETYDDLDELYGRMLGQWTRELNHVAAIVGGFNAHQKSVGQEGVIYSPVAKARQAQAVKFLNDHAFATPAWAIDREIQRRIEPIGLLSRIRNAQNAVLSSLLDSTRFARLVEQEAVEGSSAYSAGDFLADVRKGIWKELDAPQVKVDAYRRNLQRAYLDLVNTKLNGPQRSVPANLPASVPAGMFASSGDERPMYRAELKALNVALGAAAARSADRTTRAHLEGARDQIAKMLDPKFATPTGGGSGSAAGSRGVDLDFVPAMLDLDGPIEACWPDYTIQP